METKFTETQRFTQWWLWVILIVFLFIPIYGMYKQMLLGEPFGDNLTSNIGLIVLGVLWSLAMLIWSIVVAAKGYGNTSSNVYAE